MEIDAIGHRLDEIGQRQILHFFDRLNSAGRGKLLAQIESLDLAGIGDLVERYVRNKPPISLPRDIRPVDVFPGKPDSARAALYKQAQARGQTLLKEGKIGAFLVAGGQGTRLGYDGPKGEFPVTPIKKKPLFQVFAEQLLAHGARAGWCVPWYIMTSDANDAATRAFFKSNDFFGMEASDVFFFAQGMIPAFGMDGKMLLAEQDGLALSPDGHGGSLRALHKSGALADMRKRGIEHLSYFQVDNPLVHCVDPLFLGLHDLTGSEMSSKTVAKSHALEKVGNFVMGDGLLQVIEYSDLPEELALKKGSDGGLLFNSGSIAIHALRVGFVERLNASGRLLLPWHRAEKKVSHLDGEGRLVAPEKPNAVKLEQFVFDAIPLAKNPLVFETDRAEEFSPVKNAEGDDSPATCRRDQIRRSARWLHQAGVTIPMNGPDPDAIIEIAPRYATSAAELGQRGDLPDRIVPAQALYLA